MTGAECIAEAVRELSEQRKRLRCLITQIETRDQQLGRARAVLSIAQRLADEPDATIDLQYPAQHGWPTPEEVGGLPETVKVVALRIRELEDRLRKWDVID